MDPATNEVAAAVSVGEWAYSPTPHLAVYGGGVWAIVQAETPETPGTRKV